MTWALPTSGPHGQSRGGIGDIINPLPSNMTFAPAMRNWPRPIASHNNLYGYVYINMHYPELSLQEMERYSAQPQIVGVKYNGEYSRAAASAPENRKGGSSLCSSNATENPCCFTLGACPSTAMRLLTACLHKRSNWPGHTQCSRSSWATWGGGGVDVRDPGGSRGAQPLPGVPAPCMPTGTRSPQRYGPWEPTGFFFRLRRNRGQHLYAKGRHHGG